MSDAEDLSRRKAIAGKARLELSLTEEAFAKMRETAVAAWLATKDADTAFREQLYRSVKVIDAVREHLVATVQDGDVVDQIEFVARLQHPADNR